MTKSKSKTLLDNIEQRTRTVVTESEMAGLKKRWGPFHVRDYGIPVEDEYEKFVKAAPFLVSIDQTAKGLGWWKKMVFTPAGEVRDTQFVRDNLNERCIDILRNFDRFEFVDWEFVGPHDFQYPFPVYAVVAKDGSSFRYAIKGWQSGGSFVL